MTFDKRLLLHYRPFSSSELIKLGDGRTVEALGCGKVKIKVELGHGKHKVTGMNDVLYVPKLACNLFSVRSVTQNGYIVQFGHTCCWIKDSAGKLIAKGRLSNGM